MNSHGSLKFTWINDILYVEAYGPFNEEGAVEASNQYLDQIAVIKNSHYSIIEIWDEYSLGSPRVMEKIASMWKLYSENNCSNIAVVIKYSVQLLLCEKLLPPNGKVFTTKEDAEVWIISQY